MYTYIIYKVIFYTHLGGKNYSFIIIYNWGKIYLYLFFPAKVPTRTIFRNHKF